VSSAIIVFLNANELILMNKVGRIVVASHGVSRNTLKAARNNSFISIIYYFHGSVQFLKISIGININITSIFNSM
jgi:hypothetical protein